MTLDTACILTQWLKESHIQIFVTSFLCSVRCSWLAMLLISIWGFAFITYFISSYKFLRLREGQLFKVLMAFNVFNAFNVHFHFQPANNTKTTKNNIQNQYQTQHHQIAHWLSIYLFRDKLQRWSFIYYFIVILIYYSTVTMIKA